MVIKLIFTAMILFSWQMIIGQEANNFQDEIFWEIRNDNAIVWDLSQEERLPHKDNIEMSGKNVSAIIHYEIDKDKKLKINRDIIFPQLRVFVDSDASKWKKYRAYLRGEYDDQFTPSIAYNDLTFIPGPVDSVRIDGMLHFYHSPSKGLKLTRTLLPSMNKRLFIEIWNLQNTSDSSMVLHIGQSEFIDTQKGQLGEYTRVIYCHTDKEVELESGEMHEFSINFNALINDEVELASDYRSILQGRIDFLNSMNDNLIMQTPDPVINTLFYFSKIRASESIFDTEMGLVHSPGGGRYYTGVWANDQAEYSGPFFPYLGYETGNIAALNAYLQFKRNIPEGDGNFWSSFEMGGTLTCCGSDRGDAAMIAYGASQFVLARGDKKIAEELWPLIEWSLEYCERQKNSDGVITSDSDEMEGRIPTGTANLSTSSLYYGALRNAVNVAIALKLDPKIFRLYNQRAEKLYHAIDDYYGANIEGLETYKYFKEHSYLRHWICLPLVMGIDERKDATLEALFTKLWTNNGVRVEYNPDLPEPNLFWDRGTLYAFRGAFKAGAANQGLDKLHEYSKTRLLGFHVPYVVEAWPEGNMAHLSAESALYCRIITEGIFGITPLSFNSFECAPNLPEEWNKMKLRNVSLFGKDFDLTVQRDGEMLEVEVTTDGKVLINKKLKEGGKIIVVIK